MQFKEIGVLHSNFFPDIFPETLNLVMRQENKLIQEFTQDMTERVNYHDFFIQLDRVHKIITNYF